MNATALSLILVAAVAHASWNLFTKQASAAGAASFVWLMSTSGTVLYLPAVAVSLALASPRLTAASWVFVAGTGLLQTGYWLFLQTSYRAGDLSLAYPVSRGTGALLAAVAGILVLGERPGPAGLAGIALIVTGVIAIGLPARRRTDGEPSPAVDAVAPAPASAGPAAAGPAAAGPAISRGGDASGPPASASPPQHRSPKASLARVPAPVARPLIFALMTGVFIASYTLWDKHAVTSLGVPPLLQGYASIAGMTFLLAPFALRDPRRTALVWSSYRRQVLGAAVLSPLAYILVLTAMRFTAVSAIAPAREVSVLLGVLIGGRLLGEGSLPRRLAAAAAIVAGVIAIAVA